MLPRFNSIDVFTLTILLRFTIKIWKLKTDDEERLIRFSTMPIRTRILNVILFQYLTIFSL